MRSRAEREKLGAVLATREQSGACPYSITARTRVNVDVDFPVVVEVPFCQGVPACTVR